MKASKNLDESDLKLRLEQLNAETSTIESAMKLAGLSVPARPLAQDASDLIACIDAAEQHISTLANMVKSAPAATAKAGGASYSLAKKPLSYTERILAANGVSSLAELRAKKQNEVRPLESSAISPADQVAQVPLTSEEIGMLNKTEKSNYAMKRITAAQCRKLIESRMLSTTDRILRANGVSTLAELRNKKSAELPNPMD